MKSLKFEIATVQHAEPAADLFLEGKDVDRAEAVELFKDEFHRRNYFIASTPISLVAYAGCRYYNQEQDENMYQTLRLLPTGWYLRGLKVHREYRRTGIARELTKLRLAWLAEKTGFVYVFLNDDTKETLPMYKEFGFKTISDGWDFLNYEHKRPNQKGILLQIDLAKK